MWLVVHFLGTALLHEVTIAVLPALIISSAQQHFHPGLLALPFLPKASLSNILEDILTN